MNGLTGNLLALPIVTPFLGAVLCLFFRKCLRTQQLVSGLASHFVLILAFGLVVLTQDQNVMVLPVGGWPGSFGIVFAVDLFGAIMLALGALAQTVTWWYIVAGGVSRRQQFRYFHPLFCVLTAGVNWAFTTGDLFNLFVSFELILLCSYALIAHSGDWEQLRESAKYVVINILGGTLFLAAAGMMYGSFGTLNMADLAIRIQETGQISLATVLGTLFLVIFGMKAALFPLFFWLPDAYPKAPIGILPYFAGMLTKVGVYCLYRVMLLIFQIRIEDWFQPLLLWLAAATMLIGIFSALAQFTMQRLLSFHIISQIGYMIFGLSLMTPLGIAGGIFFIIHQIPVKAALFLIAGVVYRIKGADSLKKAGGLLQTHPFLSILFLLAAFSLAGIPPLSGFFGKYVLVMEGILEGWYFFTAVSLITSLFTLTSMVKIWNCSFCGESKSPPEEQTGGGQGMTAAAAGLVVVSVLVAVFSGPLMRQSEQAAKGLLEPEHYISAVLGQEGSEAYREAIDGKKGLLSQVKGGLSP